MSERRRSPAGRDQPASEFSGILMRLCDATGARGAALVDAEGETVDYAGSLGPFDIKVAAAEWRLVLRFITDSAVPAWRETRQLVVRARRASFAAVQLSDGYAVVLCLARHCFAVSWRALAEAERELCAESGLVPLPVLGRSERWTRVEVRTHAGDSKRPEALWYSSTWAPVSILGRYRAADLARGEIGYRARLTSGAELTLVREPLGYWYADDAPSTTSLHARRS
jgi:hypothetical protein